MFIHFGPATWQDTEYDTLGRPGKDQSRETRHGAVGRRRQGDGRRSTSCSWPSTRAGFAGGRRTRPTTASKHALAERQRRRDEGPGRILPEAGNQAGRVPEPADDKFGAGGGGRCKKPEAQERYDTIYREQLTELLSRYGEMFEVWFDGSSVTEVGDILKQYCAEGDGFPGPHATIRWVGNEDGVAPYPNWNAVPLARAKSGVATGVDGHPDGDVWLPNECDARIRATWFWNSNGAHTLKSLDQLMAMYCQSVGRGAVLLLNMTPDTTGVMPEADVKRAAEFGAEISRRFGKSFAETSGKGETVELDLGRPTGSTTSSRWKTSSRASACGNM